MSDTFTIGDSKKREDKSKGEIENKVIVISPSDTQAIKDKKKNKFKDKSQRKLETDSSKRQSKDKEETIKQRK